MDNALGSGPELTELEDRLDDTEIQRRKEWMEFGEEDVSRLVALRSLAESYSNEVIESLYDHFLAFPETERFFTDMHVLEHVKGAQQKYFLQLMEGSYGREYINNRLKVGAIHQRIGLDMKWYLGAFGRYIRIIGQKIFDTYGDDTERALNSYMSLQKLMLLDIELAIDTYMQTIRAQQEAIRELSTPVLQIRDRLLILPIIGVLDSQRARQLTTQLLSAIRNSRAKVVIMDITGVPSVDSQVANHLVQTVEAARLMGATTVVSGLSAEVAQTLVVLGLDIAKLTTIGDLQGAIEYADKALGYQIVPVPE